MLPSGFHCPKWAVHRLSPWLAPYGQTHEWTNECPVSSSLDNLSFSHLSLTHPPRHPRWVGRRLRPLWEGHRVTEPPTAPPRCGADKGAPASAASPWSPAILSALGKTRTQLERFSQASWHIYTLSLPLGRQLSDNRAH